MLAAALAVAALPAAGGAQPRPGGTVAVSYGEPTCFNPFLPVCETGVVTPFPISTQVIAGAFEIGPDFTYRPRLVSRVTVRRKPLTLTYHIRPQARWSDGTPVSAADFVFTHQAIMSRMPADRRGVHADVRRVRVLGPKTVHVTFRSQIGYWRHLFGLVLPRHVLAGEDLDSIWRNGIDDPKTGLPIGSGPFLLARWERGRQITLVRNPRYWRPAHIDRFVFRFTSGGPGGAVGHLLSGAVDLNGTTPTPEELAQLRRDPRFRVVSTTAPVLEHLAIRLGPGGHPALKHRAVRRALAHAIDREALVRALHPTLTPRVLPADSVMFVSNSPWHRANWSSYRHRAGAGPAQARRLLHSAGCRRGADGIYVCAGQKLSLRLFTTTGRPERQRALTIIQAQLGRVGIEIVPGFVANRALFETVLPSGNYDLALFAWEHGPDSDPRPIWGCDGERNWMGYCNRQVTRNLVQARSIVDRRQWARVLDLADAQIARDVPALPLFQQAAFLAYKRELRGVAWRPYRFNAEGWWLERSR
jgi:peptide/nickel transport system substrate-binding protein